MGIIPLLILERPVYIREQADGLYRPITYLVCQPAKLGPFAGLCTMKWVGNSELCDSSCHLLG